jgi:betaine-aldehyde dehydrogenase
MIIYPDADFDSAVAGAVRGMNFTWCGQSCGSTSRLFLHDSIHDRFLEALISRIRSAHSPGIATDMRTTMGAMVNETQMAKSLQYIESAVSEGARVATGGRRVNAKPLDRGFFIEPTVLCGVLPAMRVAQEEIFGPVLSVIKWSDEGELFEAVNGVDVGLTASIWTSSLNIAHRAAERVQAGYVWINDCSIHFLGTPYGGYKRSGMGREESKDELMEFTQIKNVNVHLA